MPVSNCCFLTWIQVSQDAGKVAWYSHLLKNFPQFVVIHTVKGFSVVNEAEVDVFLEFLCFFYDPTAVGNLISSSSALSKSILNMWEFLVHILLKPSLKGFKHDLASMWDECNALVVWAFFALPFFEIGMNWPFDSCGHCWVFQICWHIECNTFTASSLGFEITLHYMLSGGTGNNTCEKYTGLSKIYSCQNNLNLTFYI